MGSTVSRALGTSGQVPDHLDSESRSIAVFATPDRGERRDIYDDMIIDQSEFEEEELAVHPRYSITTYGVDLSVDSVARRLARGDIVLPIFQRGFVWSLTQASRFVESLLLGLPVPGVFLCNQPATQRLMIVDGNQRLQTISSFYIGKNP